MSKELNPNDIRDLKTAFEQFDRNRNGSITSDEMKECLHQSKIPFEDHEVNQVIAKMDTNKDGQVTFEEYLTFMSYAANGQLKQYPSKNKKK